MGWGKRSLWAVLWVGASQAGELDPACLKNQTSFNITNLFPAVKDQVGGTCYAEAATGATEAAVAFETGEIVNLSTAFTLCNYIEQIPSGAFNVRRKKIDQHKEFVQGGMEDVVVQRIVTQQAEFLQDSRKADKIFHEKVFPKLTRLVQRNELSHERMVCELEKGKRQCRRVTEPVNIPEALIKSLNLKIIDDYAWKHMENTPAKEYLQFIEREIHPRSLQDHLERFRTYLTPEAAKLWDRIKTPEDVANFEAAVRRSPSKFLKTHEKLKSFQTATFEMQMKYSGKPVGVAESMFDNLFGFRPETKRESTVVGLMKNVGAKNFGDLLERMKRKHESLLPLCQKAGAPFVEQVLPYLCRGIPVLAGIEEPGTEYGSRSEDGRWNHKKFGGHGAHAMMLTGMEMGEDGQRYLLFRNSRGHDEAIARMDVREACKFNQLSVLMGPKAQMLMGLQSEDKNVREVETSVHGEPGS
jgi:hypothetical protein